MTAYDDALASGSTTFCRCFRLTRRDGEVLGFTDHDADVAFGGVTYRAAAALSASEASASLGMAPDELDAQGALADDAITEADLIAGRYDGAAVEIWDVDWSDPSIRSRLGVYALGEVERGPLAFRAELRSVAAGLDRKSGRVHATLCDARFGDARCGADLSAPGRRGTATISEANGLDLIASGLSDFPSAAFDGGRIDWTSGANAGHASDVRISRPYADGLTRLSILGGAPAPVEAGDVGQITVGCRKTLEACRAFGNVVNFRGFPYMPGERFLGEYAVTGDPSQDGGSRFG